MAWFLSKGEAQKGTSGLTKIGLVIFGGVAAYKLLPFLAGAVMQLADEILALVKELALPVAIASLVVAGLVAISPWHGKHAQRLLLGAVICAFASGIASGALTWLHGPAATLTMDGVGALGSLLAAIFDQVKGGLPPGLTGG